MQGNRADGDERGIIQADAVGHAHRQVGGDGHDLGVVGLASAGARYAIPLLEFLACQRADIEDGPGAAVPEWDSHVESTTHGLDGGGDAIARGLVEHLANQVRSLARGVHQIRAAGFDEHPLGALVLHQDATVRAQRRRHLDNASRARATVLQHLLHLISLRMIDGAILRA